MFPVFISILFRYFRQSKLTSFQRQVNLYGFRRLTAGKDRGAYYHELFLRGRPDLYKRLVRIRVKGTGIKSASSPATEPDFYTYYVYACDLEQLDAAIANIRERKLIPGGSPTYNGMNQIHLLVKRDIHGMDSNINSRLLYEMARGVDPIELTESGVSSMALAALKDFGSVPMLLELIQMGFSTHLKGPQPTQLLDKWFGKMREVILIDANLLFQSSSWNQTDLLMFCSGFQETIVDKILKGEEILPTSWASIVHDKYDNEQFLIRHQDRFHSLKASAVAPRTLLSMCRLTISHCLKVTGRPKRDIDTLPISESMKAYLCFDDLWQEIKDSVDTLNL